MAWQRLNRQRAVWARCTPWAGPELPHRTPRCDAHFMDEKTKAWSPRGLPRAARPEAVQRRARDSRPVHGLRSPRPNQQALGIPGAPTGSWSTFCRGPVYRPGHLARRVPALCLPLCITRHPNGANKISSSLSAPGKNKRHFPASGKGERGLRPEGVRPGAGGPTQKKGDDTAGEGDSCKLTPKTTAPRRRCQATPEPPHTAGLLQGRKSVPGEGTAYAKGAGAVTVPLLSSSPHRQLSFCSNAKSQRPLPVLPPLANHCAAGLGSAPPTPGS